ncbi:MAG TPA: hypothetical protein DCM28_10060 [Phycisphaerales bacterium]|nr:hypothetical protein [Phycisphaerales bacterium]HCD33553.1 hypothetical protein [Phycisphaerales bacterium]
MSKSVQVRPTRAQTNASLFRHKRAIDSYLFSDFIHCFALPIIGSMRKDRISVLNSSLLLSIILILWILTHIWDRIQTQRFLKQNIKDDQESKNSGIQVPTQANHIVSMRD